MTGKRGLVMRKREERVMMMCWRWKLRDPVAVSNLDAKTGLLTGLLAGKQGWKCPVALPATCCGSKSLKDILIDSDFRAYPVINPLVTL